MSDAVIAAFDMLCSKIASQALPTAGEDQLESLYEEFLLFLSKHQDRRSALVQRLIDVMAQYRFGRNKPGTLLPSTAIAYSMHELRWDEIFDFAARENKEFYSRHRGTFMTDIMAAFDDSWEDRGFYRRFQEP